MRFMIMVRANEISEAGGPPDPQIMSEMATFHEELLKAGVLLEGSGLKPSSQGVRIRYKDGKGTFIDGPFAETKELIAGYTIIQTRTREEAMEWARRFPSPFGKMECEVEVREFYELDDFPQNEALERFRELEAEQKKR